MKNRIITIILVFASLLLWGCGKDVQLVKHDTQNAPNQPKMLYDIVGRGDDRVVEETFEPSQGVERTETYEPVEAAYRPPVVEEYDFSQIDLPDPISLPQAYESRKDEYMKNVKLKLRHFRNMAFNMGKHDRMVNFRLLAREAYRFIGIYVKPLIDETETSESMATNHEMATIHLLSAFLFYDLKQYRQSLHYLNLIETKYGSDSSIFDKAMAVDEIGFATLGEGVRFLEEQITSKEKTLS